MSAGITKDTDHVLCEIYAEFLTRRKNGDSKSMAKDFGPSEALQQEFLSYFPVSDIDDALHELRDAGLIKMYIDGSFTLLDDAIIYMENRFKNGAKELASFLAQFIP